MIPALLNIIILLALSLLHVYWGLGGRPGWNEALPEYRGEKVLKPTAINCFVVAIGLAVFAGFHLYHIGWLPLGLPDWLTRYDLWVVGGLFFIRVVGDFRYVGMFKRVKDSQFAYMDTRFYIPLCSVISLNAFLTNRY